MSRMSSFPSTLPAGGFTRGPHSAPQSSSAHVDRVRLHGSAANLTLLPSSSGVQHFPHTGGGPCRDNPHWHVFLCSSLITFFVGLLLVLTWRIGSWLVCQRYITIGSSRFRCTKPDRRPIDVSANAARSVPGVGATGLGPGLSVSSSLTDHRRQISPLPRRFRSSSGSSENDVGWMTEAKDWAGELISGQTTTGRILVNCSIVYRFFVELNSIRNTYNFIKQYA